MRNLTANYVAFTALGLLAGLVTVAPCRMEAQAPWPMAPEVSPDAQRNALNSVRSQVNWLQNSTRTAANYRSGAYDLVWQQFQMLRAAYTVFKNTLTPRQLEHGANDLAELEAGLDILAEAFSNYQQDVAGGQSEGRACRNLCQVLGRAAGVWLQEMNRVSTRLRVGLR
jgi:hypothetical protein